MSHDALVSPVGGVHEALALAFVGTVEYATANRPVSCKGIWIIERCFVDLTPLAHQPATEILEAVVGETGVDQVGGSPEVDPMCGAAKISEVTVECDDLRRGGID
ncbi:hypothetical protein GCM10012278_61960 [Nonomuraea glycinis]|uniref:Uncharacterized protein n=1 Tax=Nonomuraea glycinis TaxID=2047744 RepID=A0A918E945_9ACTN|nr:hypothetical protein [Nonomuraea glycinis]GGP12782.1 hypothetical protein GCM10012278_61960 [Nonomuraea glycinis]